MPRRAFPVDFWARNASGFFGLGTFAFCCPRMINLCANADFASLSLHAHRWQSNATNGLKTANTHVLLLLLLITSPNKKDARLW